MESIQQGTNVATTESRARNLGLAFLMTTTIAVASIAFVLEPASRPGNAAATTAQADQPVTVEWRRGENDSMAAIGPATLSRPVAVEWRRGEHDSTAAAISRPVAVEWRRGENDVRSAAIEWRRGENDGH